MSIEYYSDLDMPYLRYHKFIKFLSMQNEVGSDISSVPIRANRALEYIGSGDLEGAKTELSNLKLLHNFIQNDIMPEGLAHAVLVRSIDGKECNDLSIEGLNKVLELLETKGLTKTAVTTQNDTVKKKFLSSWRYIFPKFSTGIKLFSIWRK